RPDSVEAFCAASAENARHSIHEPGVVRFEVLQDASDHTRFVLVEVFRDAHAAEQHKATSHYLAWRHVVADMMAEPRSSTQFRRIFPEAVS
ncbi:MAG: antibiotic biosynthesis monooxygenase, partial [Bryobacteraceae bacterium]